MDYHPRTALRDFRPPFVASFDQAARRGVLTDGGSRLVSYFRTKKEATEEARTLNRLSRPPRSRT